VPYSSRVSTPRPEPDLPVLYRAARERVTGLVAGLGDSALGTRVAACPAWTVRDVLAHLAAIAEDAVGGRLTGPPTDDVTAAQVARFRGRGIAAVLATWAAAAPQFEQVIGRFAVWPAMIDVVSHEHDIRGALGRPGARGSDAVWHAAGWLLAGLRSPVPLRIVVEDAEFLAGPAGEPALELTTTRFEALRWRMGRRSRDQLAALGWSGDPAPVLDHLAVFGPAATDVIE
jgi:uncharacterized protein (TIGR03083 family)